jgi:arsenate reductase-like glutaredoxin family protein
VSGPGVQVFGRNDSQDTRRALRFFKERRIPVSFVDVTKRPPAPGELRRFSQRYGARALLDEGGKAYRDAGLGYLRMTDDEVLARVLADARLLRLPLVRFGQEVTIGLDEVTWRTWQERT